jgi:hypothetical protein
MSIFHRPLNSLSAGSNGSIVSFRPLLSYMHWGDDMESGIPGVTLFQKAEVGLLTRNIMIQGERESGARQHIGGSSVPLYTYPVLPT